MAQWPQPSTFASKRSSWILNSPIGAHPNWVTVSIAGHEAVDHKFAFVFESTGKAPNNALLSRVIWLTAKMVRSDLVPPPERNLIPANVADPEASHRQGWWRSLRTISAGDDDKPVRS